MAKNIKKSAPKASSKPASKAAKPAAKVKAKTPAKPAASASAKPAGKASKPTASKPAGKAAGGSLAKSVVSAVGKLFSKEKSDAKAQKTSPMPAEMKAPKKEKAGKKKGKKGKDGLDMEDDDLLASDEEIGSEEIPDLSEFDENEAEEIEVAEDSSDDEEVAAEVKQPDDEIVLTDAEGRRYCRVRDCDQISAVEGYCRYHYLLLWKKIQVRRKILVDGKLERYVEELTSRYPDKFLEMIRKDLRTEKDFLGAIAELEIDESANENEFEDEAQNYIDEVRGLTSESGSMSDTEEDSF